MFSPIIILIDKKNERDEANEKDEYNERDHLMNNNKIHLLDDNENCE